MSGRARLAPISERDRAVLELLGVTRFASADQIARAVFASGTPVGRRRRAQAALTRMVGEGVLTRLDRRIGGIRAGSAGFVYRLGPRSHRILGGTAKRPGTDPAWISVDHQLAVAELAAQLIEAQRAGHCSELKMIGEPDCWRKFSSSGGVRLVKADLEIRFSLEGRRAALWVEMDRATQAPARIRSKAERYLDYWRTGLEHQRLGGFPKVLFVAPDLARAEQLSVVLGEIREPAAAMFSVVCEADAVDLMMSPPAAKKNFEETSQHERRNHEN